MDPAVSRKAMRKNVGQRLRELIQRRETNFVCSNSFISICFVHNARYNSNNSYKSAAPILHHHMIILSYIQVLFRVVWVCVGGLVVESCCLALNNIVVLFQGQSDTVTNCRNIRSSLNKVIISFGAILPYFNEAVSSLAQSITTAFLLHITNVSCGGSKVVGHGLHTTTFSPMSSYFTTNRLQFQCGGERTVLSSQ